ncbi:hypothetical protein PI124_g3367 [Phytophthora idaei]|nr:hypothetical protein PI124_g3367 [Phytophthora idaei]
MHRTKHHGEAGIGHENATVSEGTSRGSESGTGVRGAASGCDLTNSDAVDVGTGNVKGDAPEPGTGSVATSGYVGVTDAGDAST